MKYKYIIFIVFITQVIVFTGCNDFLDSKPKGKLSDGILTEAEAIEKLCVSAYSALAVPAGEAYRFAFETNWAFGEVRAETAYKGGGGINDIWELNALETFNGFYPSNGIADGLWYRLYVSVQRCNEAIRYLNEISENEMPSKHVRLGEMRFLRAHFYFNLSRLFNQIVYFDETRERDDMVNISNVEYNRDEILHLISQELEEASKLLPETQDETGRVTKYAALSYQAKVNLYRAYKQNDKNQLESIDTELLKEALNFCNIVINSGKYELLSDFQHLAEVEHETGRESIFSVKHSIEDGTENGRFNMSNTLNVPRGPAYSGDGFFQPSQNLVNSFKTDNNGIPLLDTYNTGDLITVADGFVYNVDPRLDFTVGRLGIRWKNYTDEPYNESWAREPATYGYYGCKKFLVSPESPYMRKGWPWGASALDYQVIRYADLLLWKAEILIQLERQDEALPIINQIRTRAKNSRPVLAWNAQSETDYAANYIINTYQPGVNCTWTKEYALKALMFERKLELAMEGERFFDLVRWGTVEKVLNIEYLPKESILHDYLKTGSFVQGRDEYLPIPQAQINFSKQLYQQNPGY